MKSDNSSKRSRTNIIIYLLFIVVLIVLLVFYYMEKSSLEAKISETVSQCSELSEQLDKVSAKLSHKQNEVDFLYGQTDLAEQLALSMKPLKIQLPTTEVSLSGTEIDNAELCAHNKAYLGKIRLNDPSYIVDYISTDKDRDVYYIVMSEIKQLSDEICSGCETELEKANAIADWVVHNICYNSDAASKNVDADVISLEQVISTKTATCAGYSNLFAALCQSQGICTISFRGGTQEELYKSPDWKTVRINHEWNAVFCENTWHFFDTTWCSQNTFSNGEYFYSDKLKTEYLDMDFYEMSKDRRIDQADLRDFYGALFSEEE